jgi:hypothetical protein
MDKILTAVIVATIVSFSAVAQSVKFAHAIDPSRIDQVSAFCDTTLFRCPIEVIEDVIINGKLVPMIKGRVVAPDSGPNVCNYAEDEIRVAGGQPNLSYNNTLEIDVASQ